MSKRTDIIEFTHDEISRLLTYPDIPTMFNKLLKEISECKKRHSTLRGKYLICCNGKVINSYPTYLEASSEKTSMEWGDEQIRISEYNHYTIEININD
jgi:hypothetical protein